MKKLIINGNTEVLVHNNHNMLSALTLLKTLGLLKAGEPVAFSEDPEFDEVDLISENEVAILVEEFDEGITCECSIDMESDADDYYTLPNGKSAPFGLSGEELARLDDKTILAIVDVNKPYGYVAMEKGVMLQVHADALLTSLDRDLVFTSPYRAMEAYNALFGDLFGEV